ncbi:MAG: urease accessory protein UreD [Thiotrichales bacterium]|nr:urease accessory protein UreD [Thiotrichales bacterium]
MIQQQSIKEGWRGFLSFTFVQSGQRTVVKDKKHFGPLVLQRPYYQEINRPSVLVIHPPGGIVGGDVLELNVLMKPDTKGLVSTPAATKFYRSNDRLAKQTQTINLSSDCELEWLPQETLFFNESVSENSLKFTLQSQNNKLIAWDIIGLGRPARGEGFENGSLFQSLELHIEDRLIFLDRLHIDLNSSLIDSAAGLNGSQLSATALFYKNDSDTMKSLVEILQNRDWLAPVGVTRMDNLVVLRVLGNDLDDIKRVLYQAWKVARPVVIGVPAIKPRIWNT